MVLYPDKAPGGQNSPIDYKWCLAEATAFLWGELIRIGLPVYYSKNSPL